MIKLIDLKASWCSPCRLMEPIIHELEEEFKGKVEFEEIDVDEKPEIASKYGVLSIPTYILEKDGQEVARKVGFTPKAEMVKLLSS